jgi:hypothetical protein
MLIEKMHSGEKMSNEQERAVSVWPYVGYYSLMMVGLTIGFTGIALIFPSMPDNFSHAIGFAIAFGSTSFASYKFVRQNLRLFDRGEYWRITFLSSLVSCGLSLVLGGLAVAGGAMPGSNAFGPLVWIFILLIGGLAAFIVNAAGYSSRMGKSFLKAELARQARTNAETFQ